MLCGYITKVCDGPQWSRLFYTDRDWDLRNFDMLKTYTGLRLNLCIMDYAQAHYAGDWPNDLNQHFVVVRNARWSQFQAVLAGDMPALITTLMCALRRQQHPTRASRVGRGRAMYMALYTQRWVAKRVRSYLSSWQSGCQLTQASDDDDNLLFYINPLGAINHIAICMFYQPPRSS